MGRLLFCECVNNKYKYFGFVAKKKSFSIFFHVSDTYENDFTQSKKIFFHSNTQETCNDNNLLRQHTELQKII